MATIETNPQLGAQVVEDAKRYVLHSWSTQDALNPIPVAGAEGRHFWDYDGKRYLDFASQLVNVSIGYGHPKIVAAIKEQAEKLATIGPPMATEPRSTLARLISEVTPGDISLIRRASVDRGSVAIGGPIVASFSACSLIAATIFGCP